MANGVVSRAAIGVIELDQAPGPIQIERFEQIENDVCDYSLRLPMGDTNGPFTGKGLTGYNVATASYDIDGLDPTDGMSGEQIAAIPGIHVERFDVTTEDGGTVVNGTVPRVASFGNNQVLAVWADDN